MIAGNLFTRDYLLEGIVRTGQWAALPQADLDALKRRLTQLAGTVLGNADPNEAQTERDFIYPVLQALGWSEMVQPVLSVKGRKQVPDALLLAEAAAKARAAAEPEPWRSFQHGLAILEAKRWDRYLDRASASGPHEGAPSTQMLQYLSRVDIQTGGKVRLGILTNGVKWRLYFQGALSVAEDFFEVDLAMALQLPGYEPDLVDRADPRLTPHHALRLFVLMFQKAAFLPAEGQSHSGRTFHDISREAGKLWEEKVTRDLSRLVFDELFPKLVTAIAAHDPERPDDTPKSYLEEVRQGALVLLYRLLFVVYAEDRDLLPDRNGPYKDFSLTTMRLDIAERKVQAKAFSAAAVTYWPRLAAIFKAIAEGDNTFGIPPYNGGLFAKETAPLLERARLPDAIVAELIFGLSHREEDGRARYINYRDLSVQQLGSVYERTLDYGLKVADDGRVVVDADDTRRHGSGSYYTPDSLVMLIIEKTVGPLIAERLAEFRAKAEELAHSRSSMDLRRGQLRKIDPAQQILKLKICDPAMGSGHFLVSLVDWLTDKVLAAMDEAQSVAAWTQPSYVSPLANGIEEIRSQITQHADENKWPVVDEQLEDRHIVRRMVLKRCVYGLDLNPLAVELAKVALWLHTFTVGAPLSFLDHHLRCGNSLLGFRVRDAMDRVSKWGGELFINEEMQKAYGAAKGMQQVERLTDVDIAEVTESKALWVGVESMTDPLDAFMRVLYALDWMGLDNGDKAATYAWLDGRYGDPFEIARGRFLLGNGDNGAGKTEKRDIMERVPKELQADAMRFAGVLNRARALARERRFFNWQVAFPGLWTQWESSELHGGFDAVVGNPPYVRQELIRDIKPALKRAFPDTYDGTADLYVYFFDQGLRLLKPGGRLSYVVTNKWLRAGYAERLRELLAGRSWLEFVADFGHAKRFFPAADVFPSVVVLRKPVAGPGAPPAPADAQVCVIPRDDVPDKGLDEAVAKATYPLPRAHFTKESWTLEPPAVMALLDKIRRNGVPLREYAGVEPYRGILTGFNEAFLIDAATRDRLISQEPSADEIIEPYLRGQDISRWSTPDSGLFMIVMKSSGDHPWPWADAPDQAEAERRFKKAYPALHRHFKRYEELKDTKNGKPRGLRHREDHGRWWWELRPCAYYEAFEKPKTLYVDITWTSSFQVDARGRFTSNTCYFLPTAAEAVAASLNAPIGWWYSWRKAQHGKDEALRYFTSFMEAYPVAPIAKRQEGKIAASVAGLSKLVDQTHIAERTFNDWLRHELGLEDVKGALIMPSTLDAEALVAAVRDSLPRKRKLTAAEIAELKREHAATIEPARRARAEIFVLERQLSDLVNAAYGLTPEEVQLMWDTAPPRMPFTPAGLGAPVQRDDGANGEEDKAQDNGLR